MNALSQLTGNGQSMHVTRLCFAQLLSRLGQRCKGQILALQRVIQSPILSVVGLLIGAGAAKSGHGGLVTDVIAISVPVYLGALATMMLSRSLGDRVARMQRLERSALGIQR